MRIRVNGAPCACQWTPPFERRNMAPFANAPPPSRKKKHGPGHWHGGGGVVFVALMEDYDKVQENMRRVLDTIPEMWVLFCSNRRKTGSFLERAISLSGNVPMHCDRINLVDRKVTDLFDHSTYDVWVAFSTREVRSMKGCSPLFKMLRLMQPWFSPENRVFWETTVKPDQYMVQAHRDNINTVMASSRTRMTSA